MSKFAFVLLILLFLPAGCGTSLPSATLTAAAGARFGVAGLIPRNFPHASADDWIDLYETLPETGSLLGVYTAWNDSPEKAGNIPAAVSTVFALSERYGFTPVVALNFFDDLPDGSLQASIQLDNLVQRAAFRKAAVAVAEKYHPRYLGLGMEVNRFYEANPVEFESFLTLYIETYDAVKAVSPQTNVFTIYQLELIKGNGFLLGNSEGRPSHWELLSRFGDRLDLAAFTTYPFLDYRSPADIPDDYYTGIAAHTSKPLAFTEIGWPSAPLAPFPDSPFGGSEVEQAGFVARFFNLTSGANLALALWSFPHDLGEGGHPVFNSVSLRYNNGTPKPALTVWQAMSQTR
jgi:hypothetical protein